MKNWKTTLAGLAGGLLMLFGPRLQGNMNAPPITIGNVGAAIAIAILGAVSKDKNVTGGSVAQTPEAQDRATTAKV
jgi:hypothetical protein